MTKFDCVYNHFETMSAYRYVFYVLLTIFIDTIYRQTSVRVRYENRQATTDYYSARWRFDCQYHQQLQCSYWLVSQSIMRM